MLTLNPSVIINGPATADYDEDLGVLFLSDWAHESVFPLWATTARAGAPPTLENTLMNGTNTFDCSTSTDVNCIGNGTKFETTFVSGTKYRIRLINVAVDGHFQFSIDGHNLTVVRTFMQQLLGLNTWTNTTWSYADML
jgi:FtsP/CotA-like multicopper oxidase with cupredoxin domain